jgi:hypothetical protein
MHELKSHGGRLFDVRLEFPAYFHYYLYLVSNLDVRDFINNSLFLRASELLNKTLQKFEAIHFIEERRKYQFDWELNEKLQKLYSIKFPNEFNQKNAIFR